MEDEGVATTGISLVREHTAGYRPPRFLWVPFPLGRPFGAPEAPAFQRRVLRSVLALLERTDGPVVLEDFPEDPPEPAAGDDAGAGEGWVCPVSFPALPADPRDLGAALAAEIERLAPWHALSRERRGRTTVGLTGAEPKQAAAFVAALLHGTPAPLHPERSLGENLKLACEDLKAYYLEAVTAQPGPSDWQGVADWLWGDTALSRVFLALRPRLEASADESLRLVAREYLVPRVQAHRLTPSPPPAAPPG